MKESLHGMQLPVMNKTNVM